MPHLEPTYLRYIYDGLIKGSIHPENAAELPEGLIGLYEEAFDERTSVVERQKLLKRFAIWALLKKEVSAAFVAEALGEPEEEILNFISTYSAWFNSPESGKYQLYHQRLFAFLLAKSNAVPIDELNHSLIKKIEKSNYGSELDLYGLEYYNDHLLGELQDDNYSGVLKKVINKTLNKNYIDRQYQIDPTLSIGLKNIRTAILLNGIAQPELLHKKIRTPWKYLLSKRHEEFKNTVLDLIDRRKYDSFFMNLSFYENEELKFRLFNYVLRAFISSSEAKDDLIFNHFVEFSEKEFTKKEQFNWFSVSGLSETYLIETYFQAYLRGFDLSSLLDKGHFDLSAIFHLIDLHEGNGMLIPFIKELTSRNDVKKRSDDHFMIISKYHSILNSEELREVYELIDSELLRLKAEMFFSNSTKQLLNDGQQNSFIHLQDTEKLEFMYFLVSNIHIQKIDLIRKFLQSNVYSIDPVRIPASITDQMDQDQIWLAEDRMQKEWIIELSKKASVLFFIDKPLAHRTLEEAINATDDIKNGGIKGSVLNHIFDEFRLHEDEKVRGLSSKAKAKIPRIGVGSLGYGQFLADNLMDLFEEEYDLGDKTKAFNYLLKAEKEIPNLKISVKRDETRLRLIRKLLLFTEIKRAIKQVNLIENQKIHFDAVQAIFAFCQKNKRFNFATHKGIISNELETRFYFEFLLNNESQQNFVNTLFLFIDSLAPFNREKKRKIRTFNDANLALNSLDQSGFMQVKNFIFSNFSAVDNFSAIVNDNLFGANLELYQTILNERSHKIQKLRLLIALEGRNSEKITLFKKELASEFFDNTFTSFVRIDKITNDLYINTLEKIHQNNKTIPAMLSVQTRRSNLQDRWEELIPFQKYLLSNQSKYLELGRETENFKNTKTSEGDGVPVVERLFLAVRKNDIKSFEEICSKIKMPSGVQLKLLVNFIQRNAVDPGVFLKILFVNMETRNITRAYSANLYNQLQYDQQFILKSHDLYFITFILNSGYIIDALNKRLQNVC